MTYFEIPQHYFLLQNFKIHDSLCGNLKDMSDLEFDQKIPSCVIGSSIDFFSCSVILCTYFRQLSSKTDKIKIIEQKFAKNKRKRNLKTKRVDQKLLSIRTNQNYAKKKQKEKEP